MKRTILILVLLVAAGMTGCQNPSGPTTPLIIPERTDSPEMIVPPVLRYYPAPKP